MWLTTSRNIAHMEMYKVITEVGLKDVLEHPALTDFNSSSADLKSWWWIRHVRGKKSIRLLSAWKTSSSSSSLGRTRQKSRRECIANLDLSSALHTGVESRWRLLESDFAGGWNESNLIAVSISVSEPRSCLPSKHGNFCRHAIDVVFGDSKQAMIP